MEGRGQEIESAMYGRAVGGGVKRHMSHVKEGQVWQDKDKRMGGRRVVVKSVKEGYAYCEDSGGKTVRLLTRRMGPGSGTSGWKRIRGKEAMP